jgi:predicted transcriptional regulator
MSDTYERIQEFIEETDEEIHRIVVPVEEWDSVKEQADVENFETRCMGVLLVWNRHRSTPRAEIKIE